MIAAIARLRVLHAMVDSILAVRLVSKEDGSRPRGSLAVSDTSLLF